MITKYTEPGRKGRVPSLSPMRLESCNKRLCVSMCIECMCVCVGGAYLPRAPGSVPSCGTNPPFLCAHGSRGGGRTPRRVERVQPSFLLQSRPTILLLTVPEGPPSVTPQLQLREAQRAERLAGVPRRRVEPEPHSGSQSRCGGGRSPKGGKKKSAAESKRLIGGRLAGSLWPDASQETVPGDRASFLVSFAALVPPSQER